MRTRLLAVAALIPAVAATTAVPASSAPLPDRSVPGKVRLSAKTTKGAAPLRHVASSRVKCSGQLLERRTMVRGGKAVGYLEIWFNPKVANGTGIACFKHAGRMKGRTAQTGVAVAAAKSQKGLRSPRVIVGANGPVKNQVGPVAIGGVKRNGYCFTGRATMVVDGRNLAVNSKAWCWTVRYVRR
ncbi:MULTISPECIES: hypothetical protein [unclassified Luteococcus]|uniref:hypothetical protein n=1 Tax=unclassified Luteococcus TaxID=2639923 RepID=UPI00313EACD3